MQQSGEYSSLSNTNGIFLTWDPATCCSVGMRRALGLFLIHRVAPRIESANILIRAIFYFQITSYKVLMSNIG